MGHASFMLDDEIEEWVEDRMAYGQSKSAWYRYAAETMMNVDGQLDVLYERYQYDERADFIENAVMEKIKKVRSESNHEKS